MTRSSGGPADPGPPPADGGADPAPLPADNPAGRRRLPRRVVAYWRWQALLIGMPAVGAATAGTLLLERIPPLLRWLALGLIVAWLLVLNVLVAPSIRYRTFRYAVSADEVDITGGLIVTTRTVVPMNRVQHLKIEHGPLADRFAVVNLDIHTAAGTVSMRGLDSADAADLRERITRWARLADDV